MAEFDFSNAMSRWTKGDRASDFVWKLIGAHTVVYIVFAAIAWLLLSPIYQAWFEAMQRGLQNPDVAEQMIEAAVSKYMFRSLLSGFMLGLAAWVMWAVFEAAIQRHYVRDECFSLRLGPDEARLMAVSLIWAFIMTVLMILVSSLFAFVSGGSSAVPTLIPAISIFLIYGAMIFFFVRFSPVAALTIRDQRIVFFRALQSTKGRFWSMLWVFIAWLVIFWMIFFAVMFFVTIFMAVATMSSSGAGQAAIIGPLQFGVMALYQLLSSIAGIFLRFVFAGVAVLAVETGPDHVPMHQPSRPSIRQ